MIAVVASFLALALLVALAGALVLRREAQRVHVGLARRIEGTTCYPKVRR